MSLVTVDELRAQIKSSLTDAELQAVINREEAAVIRLYGAHYVDATTTVTETLTGGYKSLYLRRPIMSVDTITEDDDELSEDDEDFRVWPAQGRIERLVAGTLWGEIVEIEYVPADDNDERRALIVDLVRLALDCTAMQSESVGGEYSYTAPDWEAKRAEILGRLRFMEV